MAGWLNRRGYRSYFSGIDRKVDCSHTTATKSPWRFEQLAKVSFGPLAVIGHSVGGLLARFLGTNFPVQVRHVIALGSPLDVSSPDRIHPMVQVAFQLLTPLRQRGNPAFRSCGSRARTCRFAKFDPEGSQHVRLLRDMIRQFAADEHLRRAAGV